MSARRPSKFPLLLGALLAACSSEAPPPDPGLPPVIVVSLDTTRADHLGPWGGKAKTPHLDRVADEGVVLADLSTAATTTLASHTTLFTGTWPHTHGVPRNGFVVAPENETLAELLLAQGYRTAAVLGSYALESLFGLDQGFQYVDEEFDIQLAQGKIFDQSQRTADAVTDAALRWLSTVEDESYFLFVHYFDAHQPYTPPAPYDSMYWGGDPPEFPDFPEAMARRRHQRKGSKNVRPLNDLLLQGLAREHLTDVHDDPNDVDLYLAAQYAGEVSYMDEHLGRLFDALRERGDWEEALVLVVGDHGETFYEHGDYWNHGLAAYQTTVQVPGILKLPGGDLAGTRVAPPVSNVDLLPTMLEVLELSAPERVEGASLLPLARGEVSQGPVVRGEATQPRAETIERGGWYNRNKPNYLRLDQLKVIETPYLDLIEVYDLDKDPGEKDNLVPRMTAEAVEYLTKRLAAWREGADPLPSDFLPASNPAAMQQLRRLGYLGK